MAISRDSSGRIFVAGFSYSSWGTPVIAPSGGGPYAFVVKLESNGLVVWNTFFAGGASWVRGLALDPNGNVYVTGDSWHGWGSPTFSYPGDEIWPHWYVAKIDAAGNLQWNTFLGPTYGIVADASGNVYLAGMGTYTWGNLVRPYQGAGTEVDACVTKIDTDGALVWNACFGGTSIDVFRGVALDAGGSIFLAGTRGATSNVLYPDRLLGGDAYVVALPSGFGSGAPTLDAIGDLAIDEDAGEQTVDLTGITAGPGEIQSLTVKAVSSNPSGIPNPAVNYTSPDATGTLTFTPVANASGTATITVTVDDGQSANNTVVRTFLVTVNATQPAAYVLWTRSDTGQAVLWNIDPNAGSGTPKAIPVNDLASVRSTSGVGGPWQATSYAHVSATEGYVLWTRSDTGHAVLWRINPSAGSGAPKVIPVDDLASLRSTSGVGGPWQASSYFRIGPVTGPAE